MKMLNNQKVKQVLSFFMIFLILVYTIGCNYYKINKGRVEDLPSIQNIGKIHKRMIVHAGSKVFSIKDIQVDSAYLSGNLEAISDTSYYYDENNKNQRYKTKEKDVLNEVHIFLNSHELESSTTKIALSNIKEIHIIDKDTGRTVVSYVFGTLGVLAGAFVVLMVIILLTKSSCPYVYTYDGEAYIFEGETFGGAIAPNLERDDYMPLPNIQAKNSAYRIRISNELLEKQYTDLAELMVVSHPKNQKVLLDKNGQPQLISNAINPVRAMSSNGNNLSTTLQKKDRNVFLFNEPNYSQNSITMTFKKPMNSTTGKLILNGKNTLWFDYQFGEFISKFGKSYNRWMEQQSKIPSEQRLEKIKENDFPLSVYIKKNGKWVFVNDLLTVGPLASRDFVLPIEVADIQGDEVEVKIETGFMFWEMDYAAMDFTDNQNLKVDILKPTTAFGTGSRNWTSELKETDKNYMIQDSVGQITEIIYPSVKTNKEDAQTVFLHTRGYYTLIRNFEGLPQIAELNKFKVPGHFSDFSRTEYLKILDNRGNLAFIPKNQ